MNELLMAIGFAGFIVFCCHFDWKWFIFWPEKSPYRDMYRNPDNPEQD